MQNIPLLNQPKFQLTLNRLSYQLIENHDDFRDSVIIGLQPRGLYLSRRLVSELSRILPGTIIQHGILDNTFYRDDFRHNEILLVPNSTEINFIVEKKKVILVDDVLFTGRTVRAGMDALLAFGRPAKVELLVLVDRRFSRQVPIEPDYIGMQVDSRASQKVKVNWNESEGEDSVILITEDNE